MSSAAFSIGLSASDSRLQALFGLTPALDVGEHVLRGIEVRGHIARDTGAGLDDQRQERHRQHGGDGAEGGQQRPDDEPRRPPGDGERASRLDHRKLEFDGGVASGRHVDGPPRLADAFVPRRHGVTPRGHVRQHERPVIAWAS